MSDTNIKNVNEEVVSAEELMKKFDKDSKNRHLTGAFKWIYDGILIAFAVFVLFVALISRGMTEFTKLPLFLGLIMVMGFLKFPACEKDALKENYIPWYDIVLAVLSLACCLYYVINQNTIIYMGGEIETAQIIVGIIFIL